MTSGLEIVEVSADGEVVDRWHAVTEAAGREGLGGLATVWTLPEMRVFLFGADSRARRTAFVGVADGEVVAAGLVTAPRHDNLTSAEVAVWVLPDHRRRGLGSAMLAHLEAWTRSAGRPLLDATAEWPYAAGYAGAGWPGAEFARARGYALVLGDVQRVLDLPVADGLLDDLAAEAAPHHTAYELRSWVGPVPDALAHSWMELSSTLITEAPTGERAIEPEVVDVAVLRAGEESIARQGRIRFHTVALDAAGRVAAYTDAVATPHEAGRAYQWGTLVRPADRGHRLGLAVKVANLRQVQSHAGAGAGAGVERLVTFNAEVNDHMIGINERLGFRPVARMGEFQKRLG